MFIILSMMVELIGLGLAPCPLREGDSTSRLEIIKDIPVGKAIHAFEATDIAKVKEVPGNIVCLRGNLPISIMATGTPEDVRAHSKKLIDVVDKDGGFIMDTSTWNR